MNNGGQQITGATGFTGLARNPDDDTIWGIIRIGAQFDRRLVRLDNINLTGGTADATEFGDLGDRFSALAFVPTASVVPEPGSMILLSLGGLALALRRTRNGFHVPPSRNRQ